MTSRVIAAAVIAPVLFLFPGRRQLLPRGMEPWQPDAYDDGDLDDLPVDDRPEAERAAG